MNWIIENKEWLFSGLGLAIVLGIIAFFTKKKEKIEVNNFFTTPNKSKSKDKKDKTKAELQTLFIDDEKFDIVDILKKADFPNTKTIKDVHNLDSPDIKNADVIFVDVNGVGCKLFPKDQGLGLAEAIKSRNPKKYVVIYSAQEQRLHKAFSIVDAILPKNADPYEFINLLENYLRK
jgi:DNA-binding NarL/FixJ family response regulator